MINSKDLTLEQVCKIANGFLTDYNAVSYLISLENKKVKDVKPKQFAKYQIQYQKLVKEIDPIHYSNVLKRNKSGYLLQWEEERIPYKRKVLEYKIGSLEKEIKQIESKKETKPISLTYKGKEYDIDYKIRYQNWWYHAIYQNTKNKSKDNENINPISLALACFMCHNIKGTTNIEDIAEIEETLLGEKDGVKLYKIGS